MTKKAVHCEKKEVNQNVHDYSSVPSVHTFMPECTFDGSCHVQYYSVSVQHVVRALLSAVLIYIHTCGTCMITRVAERSDAEAAGTRIRVVYVHVCSMYI